MIVASLIRGPTRKELLRDLRVLHAALGDNQVSLEAVRAKLGAILQDVDSGPLRSVVSGARDEEYAQAEFEAERLARHLGILPPAEEGK